MLIEAFGINKATELIKSKEHLTSSGGLDNESIFVLVFTVLWTVLWIITIITAIQCTKIKSCKNPSAALIVSVLSWPIFWLFKITGAIC